MFINYWIVLFASVFFSVYWLCPIPSFRKTWLLLGCLIFHYNFAGPAGVAPIIVMGVLTYFAGLSKSNRFRTLVIVLCALELVFYKYSAFLVSKVFGLVSAAYAKQMLDAMQESILPAAPPLAISFFVFEFVHYLVDVNKGKQAIRSVFDFTLFSIFWPSVVAGPVKRFDQFLPSVVAGCKKVTSEDIQIGVMRVMLGLFKKLVIAENLTRYINFWHTQFASLTLLDRWTLVACISLRILCDFSGYSDIAIGLARMMGIRLPENFNWPYLATNLQEFWQRWHMSLSTWIRDYIYIPLGGNKHGITRKLSNLFAAFAICGLWHGADWNFLFWGAYHGAGLVAHATYQSFTKKNLLLARMKTVLTPATWLLTFAFVSIGWLFFFYPVSEAASMLKLLIKS